MFDTDYMKLVIEIENEFPKFKIVRKSSSLLMKLFDVGLKIITFGKMNTFMDRYTTTVLYTVYIPSEWLLFDRSSILRHERVHMRQLKRYGVLWFWLSYTFLFFPCIFSYFRKKYEQEAYEETLRYAAEKYGVDKIKRPVYREQIIENFTTAKYFWTWPWRKSIERWYDETVETIEKIRGEK